MPPNNRGKFGGTEIWIWSEISFLRVDTINLVSARNGKVGRTVEASIVPHSELFFKMLLGYLVFGLLGKKR